MTVGRPSAEIAITARICVLYGDFSGRSDSRFSCFESPVVPREKRGLLLVQRLVGSAPGPALIKPCSQLLGVTLRMWRPFRLDLAGLRPSTNCASVSATCLGDSGGSWRVPDKNRPPRWSVAAGVVVSRRRFHCAREGWCGAKVRCHQFDGACSALRLLTAVRRGILAGHHQP